MNETENRDVKFWIRLGFVDSKQNILPKISFLQNSKVNEFWQPSAWANKFDEKVKKRFALEVRDKRRDHDVSFGYSNFQSAPKRFPIVL